MAVPTTQVFLDGDNTQGTNHSYAGLAPLYQTSDLTVKVLTAGTWAKKDLTTHYTVNTGNSTIQFTSGNVPPSGTGNILIERITDIDNAKATYATGASIKAADLTNNNKQSRYSLAELSNSKADILNPTFKGNITFASTQTFDGRDLSVDGAKLDAIEASATADQTAAEIRALVESASDSNVFTDADHSKLNAIEASADVTDATNVNAAGAVMNSDTSTADMQFVVDEDNFASDSATKVPTQQSVKAYIGTTSYTKAESDGKYYGQGTVEEIQSGETWTAADNKVATTSAIDARIIDLVDDVGGFVPIANETSFPTANPDVNNGAGTLVSIKEFASSHTPSGGSVTIANGAGSGNTVTITGCGSTVLAAGFGGIVETTTTLHTYTFHRLTPKATEVTTVAANVSNISTVASNDSNITSVAGNATNINSVASNATNINTVASNATNVNTVATNITDVSNFADLYQIATSAPTNDGGGNSLAAGDLWFDSSSNKVLKVHNGTSFQSVSPTQSVLNDISNVSGQLTYAEDLGSIADALTTETGNNINTVATNINNINSFSDQYRVASSAPSSSLDEGDLWFDTTGNALKVYNGTTWVVTASAGMAELSEDTTPELGGNLDCNNKNLTEVGTVSGDNLQIDFGAIA